MDGNGRWAASRGKLRIAGHRAGVDSVLRAVDWCRDAGIGYLTLYAFSTENWRRSEREVSGLMRLMGMALRTKVDLLRERNVRLRVIGRLSDLSASLQRKIAAAERDTAKCDGLQLTLAISYGGRAEIAEAARRYACDVRDGKADAESLSEEAFRRYLYAPDVPDPDLVIRTSGEFRLSNFLLWQSAYAELWVTPVLWPDFSEEDFRAALRDYAARDRRMGGRRP
jgi:undecaprenyl diphosphate synthase